MAIPAAREPGPLVILLRLRTVAKVDSIVILGRSSVHLPELGFRVVDGVVDVLTGVVGVGFSRGRLLPDRNVFGVGCPGAGRERGRVGGAYLGVWIVYSKRDDTVELPSVVYTHFGYPTAVQIPTTAASAGRSWNATEIGSRKNTGSNAPRLLEPDVAASSGLAAWLDHLTVVGPKA
jgi:hypothetical protein